jgi:dTDP-4-amino-4,6-dideoxygalactose transaminase
VPGIPFVDLAGALGADREALIEAFTRVLDSGRYVLGPEVERFESAFAQYCGVHEAVGVGNGLDALALSLQALDIGPGDEVVVPAHTFIATWLAVARCGATPVPVEPDPRTYLARAGDIAARFSPRTRAVIAVHLYGSLAGIEDIAATCRERGIALLEDAAQAHGAACGGIRAGAFGMAGCFSFYPTKNLGAFGDGGAVVTDDKALAARVRSLRSYGSLERYRHEELGSNSRLDELQAALLQVRLARLDADNLLRRAVAAMYLRQLDDIDELQLPDPGPEGSHAWHLFVVRTPRRDALQDFLAQRGIGTLIHYPSPVYRFPPFAAFGPAEASTADRITAEVLSLPMAPHLTPEQIGAVIDAVRSFFQVPC